MNLERDALALFARSGQNSSQLRDKLTSFIEELKILHSHDQSQRNHKLEQIAMYEERIREIDLEAAARKRVLHAEIEDLRRQIELMDTEKNDIQDVIASFHKELHVS
jgi:chromosome segregation ATPase